VLTSRGHLSLPMVIGFLVITAVAGPMIGHEADQADG